LNTSAHTAYERRTAAKTLVLCVHGIQGSPLQFEWLVKSLPSDVDYKCILLPGHGTTIQNFRKTGAAEWVEYTYRACMDAKEKYKCVIYVGHSMGCLLGINAAASLDMHFDAMLLMACPIRLKPSIRYFVNNYRAVAGCRAADPYVDAVRRSNSVRANSPYQYLSCIKPYVGLFKLTRKAKKQLADLRTPVTLIHSEKDEIVSKKSLATFENNTNNKPIVAAESGHFLYTSEAKRKIQEELNHLIFISRN